MPFFTTMRSNQQMLKPAERSTAGKLPPLDPLKWHLAIISHVFSTGYSPLNRRFDYLNT
jgi:hypothetical protein